MKLTYTFCVPCSLLLALTLLLSGCKNESEDPTPKATGLDFLAGQWERTDGNNTNANGMIIEINGDQGIIIDPANTSLSADDIKWKSITVVDDKSYEHLELGSDYNYYDASITINNDNEIQVTVAAAGTGNFQIWQRIE